MNITSLRTSQSTFIFFTVFGLAVASGQTNTWLDVCDFGASGSKFETVAVTREGSKQITVKNAGDFKVGQGVMVSKVTPPLHGRQAVGAAKGLRKITPRWRPRPDARL